MSRIKVDTATNKLATGPVDFPDGITGVAATFTGNVTVGGTITYDDVTNVDSVGIITARLGIDVQGGLGVTCADSVKSYWGTGGDLSIYHDGTHNYIEGTTAADTKVIQNGNFLVQSSAGETILRGLQNAQVDLWYNNSKKLETTSSGVTVTGTVGDTKGTDVRSLPVNSQVAAYQLVAADAGKMIKITTGGVTCPNGESFVAGDMITIMNESGSSQTITEGGGATLYWTADGTNGNRTLGARGVATIVMSGSSAFYISGSGLS